MVIAAFPIAKLGALFMRQISKPIANVVKTQAKNSPIFRHYVCIPPATFYNWVERKGKMWLLKMGQPVNFSVLNEQATIDLGAELLGETVIFLIAASLLIAEYTRSSWKEQAKEAAKKAEMEALKQSIRDLFIQTEEQGAHIRELTRKIGDMESRVVQKPWVPKSDPPPPPPPRVGPFEPVEVPEHNQDSPEQTSPSPDPIEQDEMHQLDENCKYRPLNDRPSSGLIFKGLGNVERDFLHQTSGLEQRHPGIIAIALNLLYQDVYRKPLKF